jgi:hypothetical protein
VAKAEWKARDVELKKYEDKIDLKKKQLQYLHEQCSRARCELKNMSEMKL